MPAQTAIDRDTSNRILKVIKEGMEVYDRLGKKIGTVTDLYLGASSPESNRRGTGSATAPSPDMRGDTLVDDIARVFVPDDLPQVLRDRLIQNGFVKLNGEGLFSHARYILPNQIDSVAGNRVDLRVSRDELIKRDTVQS
ncbi:MAG: hypothetical protein ACYDBJ_13930 [Aggregatilineales bacterium]